MSSSGGAAAVASPVTPDLQLQLAALAQQWTTLSVGDAVQRATQSRVSIDASAADRLASRRALSAHTKVRAARQHRMGLSACNSTMFDTQEWKALPVDEQTQAVPTLIKAYQVEVDAVGQHSRLLDSRCARPQLPPQ